MMRLAVVAVALALAARISAADDNAKSRSGSSSSSSAGSRHHSSSSSSSSQSSSSKSSSSDTSDSGKTSSSTSSSSPTPAQRRHPRAGTGTGNYPYDHHDDDYDYDYNYGSTLYFGYPAYYYSGSAGYSGGGYGPGYGSHGTASLRVIVEPEKTKVYVDGYYAGTAADFDGLFQRLHVAAGRHEITLKLEGYRTHRFQVDVPVGQTVKLRHDMARGAGEDAEERVGEEPEVRGGPAGYVRMEEPRPEARVDPRGAMPADTGRLRVDVRPPDASIYIDGIFRGSARAMDGVLLPSGRHRVEIVRPGYRTEQLEIDVRSGETTDLRADLDRSS
jgi:PEGA domain-containing protein